MDQYFPTFLKCINETFVNSQHLYCLKWFQSENDEYQAITVA